MHASFGPVRSNQTTGSMISHLTPSKHAHWLTGTSAPCTSVFKPVWLDSGLPDLGPTPTETYDQATLWWHHENLHREVLRDYVTRINVIQAELETLEKGFIAEAEMIAETSCEERASFTQRCFDKAQRKQADWLLEVRDLPIQKRRPKLHQVAWRNFDRNAQRPNSLPA
jgi:dipeptidase